MIVLSVISPPSKVSQWVEVSCPALFNAKISDSFVPFMTSLSTDSTPALIDSALIRTESRYPVTLPDSIVMSETIPDLASNRPTSAVSIFASLISAKFALM